MILDLLESYGTGLSMAKDRRKSLRRTFSQPAGLFHPNGKRICSCVMRDISDSGARLKIGGATESSQATLPPKFILAISKSGNVFRRCELVWRRKDEVGVRFSGSIKPA